MFRKFLIIIGLVAGLSVAAAAPVSAADVFPACKGQNSSAVCSSRDSNDITGSNGIFKRVVNVLLFITGAVAVIMIVVGGLRYVISGGDSSAVNSAKNTILYAIVGLVLAIFAYAIVNFVIDELV